MFETIEKTRNQVTYIEEILEIKIHRGKRKIKIGDALQSKAHPTYRTLIFLN